MPTIFGRFVTPLLAVLACLLVGPDTRSFADEPVKDARPQRLLLIGQGPDGSHKPTTHEYFAGVNLLARLLREQPKLEVVVVSADGDWRDGPQLLERADAAVMFVAEGAKWLSADAARLAAFRDLAKRGGGLGVLHWGTGTRVVEPIAPFVQLFGACHGGPDRKYKDFDAVLPQWTNTEHAILRGIKPFAKPVKEEFYFALKQASKTGDVTLTDSEAAITPLLRIPADDVSGTVAWCWERPDQGRSFGFTGLHFHNNWKHESYRRFVAQATLWALKRDIPAAGIDVPIKEEDLALPTSK